MSETTYNTIISLDRFGKKEGQVTGEHKHFKISMTEDKSILLTAQQGVKGQNITTITFKLNEQEIALLSTVLTELSRMTIQDKLGY
jgi:hypothetical protein